MIIQSTKTKRIQKISIFDYKKDIKKIIEMK